MSCACTLQKRLQDSLNFLGHQGNLLFIMMMALEGIDAWQV